MPAGESFVLGRGITRPPAPRLEGAMLQKEDGKLSIERGILDTERAMLQREHAML